MPRLSRFAGTLVARKRDTILGTYRDAYAKTDISIGTWERVEKEGSFQMRTLWRVVEALGWPPEAAEMLLNDQDPDGRLDPGIAPASNDEDVIDRWVASTEEELEFILSEAGFEARAEVVNLARRVLESEFYRSMSANPLEQPGLEEGDPVTFRMIKYRSDTNPQLSPAPPRENVTRLPLTRRRPDAEAAHDPGDTKQGRKARRPSPEPEPEGP